MSLKLVERRQNLLNLRSRGISLSQAVKELAERYGVSPRQLYYDWKSRGQWMEEMLDVKDKDTFLLDLVSNHKEIYRLASLEYLKAENENARIGALRLLRDINLDFAEMIVSKDTRDRVEAIEGKMIKGSVLVGH